MLIRNILSLKRFLFFLPLTLIIFIFTFFRTTSILATSTLTWITKSPMPTARCCLGLVEAGNGKIYAIGGIVPGFHVATVEEYNPLTNTWQSRTSMPTQRSKLGVVLANNGKIYAIGGYSGGSVTSKVEEYNPISDTWVIKTPMSTARGGLGVVAAPNGKIYAIGGHSDMIGILATVEEYDPLTDTWTTRANMPTIRHLLGVAAATNGKIYAIGGFNQSSIVLDTVQEYDPVTDTWSTRANMPTARAGMGVSAATNGKIYAIGGTDGPGYLSTVEEYDPFTDIWIVQTSMPTARNELGVAITTNDKIYAVGGSNIAGFLATVEEALFSLPNQPPTVDAGGPYSVDESSSVQVTATGNDPENGPLTYAWDLDNNGSFETPGQTVTFSAAGLDGPSNKTIAVQVTDNGNLTATDQATVAINNTNPTVGTITAPTTPVQVNTLVNASASFTDPGVLDTHTAVWDWGDENTTVGTITETNGSGSVSGSHIYTVAGVYTITLTVTDDDTGVGTSVFQYISVYNPTPQGLFSGARIFTSPVGSVPDNPTVTGQVQFGVTTKYFDSSLIGDVEMNFNAGNINFVSTSLTVLVTSGANATLRGTGTINGSGSYTFLVTGFDGHDTGTDDLIRFQIKNSLGNIVYDTQPSAADTANPITSITGQIIVH